MNKPANNQTLRDVARGRAGRHTLEGRSRGAFSDSFTAAFLCPPKVYLLARSLATSRRVVW